PGIENCYYDYCAEVVYYRERQKEQLQRQRHSAPQKGEHAEREGYVRRRRNGPAAHSARVVEVKEHVNERGDGHAAHGGYAGERNLIDARKLAVEDLAFYFEADQQKEYRHQPVVYPQEERLGYFERPEPDLERRIYEEVVEPRERGV